MVWDYIFSAMTRGRGRPQKSVASSLANTLNLGKQTETNTASTNASVTELIEKHKEEKEVTLHVLEVEKPKSIPEDLGVKKKLWVDVISRNRLPSNGVAIEFCAQKIEAG